MLRQELDLGLQKLNPGQLELLLARHLCLVVVLLADPLRVQGFEFFVNLVELVGIPIEGVLESDTAPNLVVVGRTELLEHHW